MKKHYLIIKTFLASLMLVGFMSVSTSVDAQMSGAYTIDKSVAASSTNFTSFTMASDSLNLNGVNGPVRIEVIGTYTEQVEFKAVTGASSTNTITLFGSGTLQFSATSSSSLHTLYLNGADYFIIDGLSFKALGSSYAVAIRLANNADYNKIQNCDISIPNFNIRSQRWSSTSNRAAGIAFYGVNTRLYYRDYAQNGKENLIYNNKIYGGSGKYGPCYGIFEGGANNNSYNSNNTIDSNNIIDYGVVGIMTCYHNGTVVTNNTLETMNGLSPSDGGSWGYAYGIYNYFGGSQSRSAKISNNTIKNLDVKGNRWNYSYAIYNQSPNNYTTNSNRFIVEGNTIKDNKAGNYNYGYYGSGGKDVDIRNNSVVDFTGASDVTYSLFVNSQINSIIENNTVYQSVSSGSRTYYGGYFSNGSTPSMIARNNVVINKVSTGTNYLYYGFMGRSGTDYVDFDNNLGSHNNRGTDYFGRIYFNNAYTNYKTVQDLKIDADAQSDQIQKDVNFIDASAGDYAINDFPLNNSGISNGLTTDIWGRPRNPNAPDLGAYEVKLDAVSSNLVFTGSNECGNYQEAVTFNITNNTVFDFTDVPVGFSIEGVEKDTGIIANISAGQTETFTFKKDAKFNIPGTNLLEVYVKGPDDVSSSDTLNKTLTITSSPYGSVYSYNNTSGDIRKGILQDVTIPGEAIVYDVSAPAVFTQADYTTKWTATPKITTENGTPLPTSSYTWTAPTGSTPGTISFDPPVAFTDTVINVCMVIKDVVTNCDTTLCKEVFVAPIGKPDFKTEIVLCEGDAVLFDNTSTVSTGAVENEWVFIPGDSAFSTHPVYSFASPGVYPVTLTNITNPYGYKTSITKNITITATPKVSFERVNACEGTAIILTNTTPDPLAGSNNFDWTFGDGTANSSNKNETHNYVNPGSYKVTLSVEANGCIAELSKNVYQFATPVAAFSLNTGTCDNEKFTFNNTSTIALGVTGYLWDFDDNGNLSTESSPEYQFTSPGTKNVWLKTTSEFGCVDSTMQMITVKASPVSQFSNTNPCSVDPTVFSNTSVIPAGQTPDYAWDFGNGTTSITPNPVKTWTNLGPKVITLTTTLTPNGCTHTIVKEISVGVQPTADFEVADVCTGEEAVFVNKTTWPQGTVNYEWVFGDGMTSTEQSPTHKYTNTSAAVINVTLYAEVVGGCKDSVTEQVIVNEGPKTCDFEIGNKYVESHTYAEFTPTDGTTPAPQSGVNYLWKFEGGGTSTDPVAKHHFVTGDTYDVTMIARKGDCECIKTKSVTVNFTGIKSTNLEKSVMVYPNPNNGRFTVAMAGNTTNAKAKLYTITGAFVQDITLNEEVNIANLKAGVYLVQVLDGNKSAVKRITIQ